MLPMDMLARWPAKSAEPPGGIEHPAVYHMLDVAAVAERLIEPFGFPDDLRDALVFLTGLHDLGKVSQSFRSMLHTGAPQVAGRHWELTEVLFVHHDVLLEEILSSIRRRRFQLYAASAGHHGRPPNRPDLRDRRALAAIGDEAITHSRDIIRVFAALWPGASLNDLSREKSIELSWWLPGFIAVCDWIGSNTDWFPPMAPEPTPAVYLHHARDAAAGAVAQAGLAHPAPAARKLFDFALRPMQQAAEHIDLTPGPMLAVIEDETGAGKTEAALILAQRMLCAGKGRGVFFALPTMATADAMFARARQSVARLYEAPPSLTLAHGRSRLSEGFRELIAESANATDEPVCTEWLADNRRRALLATVGVGTIDQALLSVLPTKHASLRHFGLSSKILIVDEVHELGEPYLAEELAQLLRAHRMAGGSAILLTATLPLDQRCRLFSAYEAEDDKDPAYPAMSVAGGAALRKFPQTIGPRGPVSVVRMETSVAAVDYLKARARDGAACVWVRNAVDDAIAAVLMLRSRGVSAELLHARFALSDRLAHERAALDRFGKRGTDRAGHVLVATQVVESSLDLDFDVMVSDLAPLAALVQRAGRLWRHMDERPKACRPVPEAVLHVVSPDPDKVADAHWLSQVLDRGAWVYPLDLQWRSAKALFTRGWIEAPTGLRALIEEAHGPLAGSLPDALIAAELEREGKGYAAENQARHNLVKLEDGYRSGGAGADDTDYPTRLGLPTRTLMLVLSGTGHLAPYAGTGPDGWQRSEVQAAERRLHGLDLPDQSSPAIEALTRDWPDWRRRSVTVCPMDEDGRICEGLRYDRNLGLLYEAH